MSRLYSSPLRVYLLLGALGLAGILAGWLLPVSLFPNSTKPNVSISMAYGNQTAEEFLNTYGKALESQLRAIANKSIRVEKIEASYAPNEVRYWVKFHWGVEPEAALREVQLVANSFAARLSTETRDSLQVYIDAENNGFFAASFFSEQRDLNALYDLLEPILTPHMTKVQDAQNPSLWNPTKQEIRIELLPAPIASLQLFPQNIEYSVLEALAGRSGGSVPVGESRLQIQMPRQISSVEDLARVAIPTPSGKAVHLSEVARIDIGPQSLGSRIIKTNGAASLILFATPKPGGNVKKMSEDLLKIIDEVMPSLPKDVQYRVLVDPSEFIRSAVNNVFHEVLIAAMLAVIVLFLFIGSFRNVATAAIEIPLSMILAFLLMQFSGMNLNLISLGGLALAAGMNVDASVVVMENIFRHFERHPGPHDFSARLRILTGAVREVMFPIIASTIASLVVFLPLTFTSDLSYAILGDLAKAVVFSHGLSAVVALILVPTVRLHLMAGGGDTHAKSPIEGFLKRLELGYAATLGGFLRRPRLKWGVYAGLAALLGILAAFVLPRLPREIVGLPDTDWMVLSVNTTGNSLIKHMEVSAGEIERDLLREFGDKIKYTFTQIVDPNRGWIMARLKNKREMRDVWKKMEARFTNTPVTFFWVGPWNPSELPIPDPPHMRIALRGGTIRDRADTARELSDLMQEKKIFHRAFTQPSAQREQAIYLSPHVEQWTALRAAGNRFTPGDIADLLRVATTGKRIGEMTVKDRGIDVILRYPSPVVQGVEDVGSFPIGIGGKLVPLRALTDVTVKQADPPIYREDERELFLVLGREKMGEENKAEEDLIKAKAAVAEWEAQRKKPTTGSPVTVTFEEPAKDLKDAITQLSYAVGLSILLIFLTMLIQFGSVVEPLLVLVSVPLGFLGVLISLWVFGSTLSLNSILGVILLNGIAVANSIILVDFIKRMVDGGMAPREAAMEAARERLRPILITSLTTILGMLPIAIGMGEGGRILQPLGIAVSGGMWVSMGLTLFLVPALQVSYLEWRASSRESFLGLFKRLVRRRAVVPLLLFSTSLFAAPEPAANLSFEQALEEIVGRSTAVGSQQAQVELVAARTLPSRLSLLPSITGQATQSVYDLGLGRNNRRGIEGRADLNLFKFGADFSAMAAANAEIRTQEHLLADTYLKTESDAVRSLVSYIQTALEIEILNEIQTIREEAVRIARERYQRGLLAAQEADKFSIDLDNSRARLSDASITLANAKAELAALLGHSNVKVEWPWKPLLSREKLSVAADDFDLSTRPDWRAAETKAKAAEERKDQAWGKVLPSLDLSFTYGHYWNDANGFTGAPAMDGLEWRGVLALSIPIFDRLENLSSFRASVESKKLAELDLEKVRRNAKSDFDSSQATLTVSLKTAKLRDQTMETSRKLYRDNLARFRKGLVSANDLIIDQDRLNDSQLNAIRGWAAAHTNFTRSCHSAGRRLTACLNQD